MQTIVSYIYLNMNVGSLLNVCSLHHNFNIKQILIKKKKKKNLILYNWSEILIDYTNFLANDQV